MQRAFDSSWSARCRTGPMQNGPQLSPRPEMFSAKGAADQLTASLRALPALNFGWFDAAMVIVSPVRGLRPVEALRLLTANVPKPTRRTSPPFFSEPVIASKTASTALLAAPLVRPLESATAAIRSCLFMPKEPLQYGWFK